MKLFPKTLAAALAASTVTLTAAAQQMTVETGTTEPVRLSRAAANVVIGNQNIADVAVADPHMIFLTGKSFGTTNLIVLDANNNIILSTDVVVTTNAANLVTINRGGSSYTYDCVGECRDAPVLGDNADHFGRSLDQAEQLQRLTDN
ncbi:pilus assembly protein N-terminal domain-containing protein [Henriciella marina]|uniref:pilus assembly protein N-terminal domain-containing protein n=1 Tax=Henriciella marina TaxID=453851 RepID=UPI00036DC6CF|nr:pilus assembly protein N-terminal domain-containing protein [Henriciella marina]